MQIDFGVDVFHGTMQASVFLEMELGTILDMQHHVAADITDSLAGLADEHDAATQSTGAMADPVPVASATALPDGPTATNITDTIVEAEAAAAAAAVNATSVQSDDAVHARGADVGLEGRSALGKITDSGSVAVNAAYPKAITMETSTETSTWFLSTPTAISNALATTFTGIGKRAVEASRSSDRCITLTNSLSIAGGLQGTLKPLFDQPLSYPIFSTSGQLYQVSSTSLHLVELFLPFSN